MEITNVEQLKAYMKKHGIKYKTVARLEGGVCNFVFRIIGEAGKPIIVKHAEPYVAGGCRIPFTTDRMDFEYAALTTLPKYLSLEADVSCPVVYHYDSDARVMMMADGGERTLKDAYTDSSIQVSIIGEGMGRWLAHLHASTKSVDIGDHQAGKAMYRYCYYTMAGTLEQYGFDPSLGARINDEYGSLLLTDDDCICHGDFWPNNMLLRGHHVTVVDWEMCRRGCGATDVGQFAAESYLLDRFRGGRGLLPAFLRGYHDADKSVVSLKRVAVHVGAHLICWPVRARRGTEKEVRECIEMGIQFLEAATSDDMDWFRGSVLKELL